MNRSDGVLRLHVAAGTVWYGNDGLPAADSGRDEEGFVGSHLGDAQLSAADSVRIMGCATNARLICCLDELSLVRPLIYLVSPAVVPVLADRDRPDAVLRALWQPALSAGLPSRWHQLTKMEILTYAMIAAGGDRTHVPDVVRSAIVAHPAWPALSFVSGLNVDAACRLVCTIVDPRWYRHESHPGRRSRLYAYLGLCPANMAAIVGRGDPSRHHDRAANVVNAWYRGSSSDPFFLSRCHQTSDLAAGILSASCKLVDFVDLVWSTRIAGNQNFDFHPFRFFGDGRTAQRYVDHADRL
jgi:hypothetical protein